MKVISLFLLCCDCVLPEHNFFAEFKISIKDQINKENHVEKIGMYAYMCVHTHVPPILFHLVMFLCKFCLNFFVLFLTEKHWFTTSSNEWGFLHFMPLKDLLDASKGLLVNDALIVEGEIIVMSYVK